ncbi:30S ribosomal protein S10 [Candidatus Micrarchaeota archaeon]|nr:30S ribosomal protein S10 [Candidatus Micrarchaeota archaeon]
MAGKARITVTSPDAKALDDICTQIKDITKATGIALSGPVYLPTKRLMVAVRRSPCGDGSETFEHWEMRVHKRLMDIAGDERTLRQIMRIRVPENVAVRITLD